MRRYRVLELIKCLEVGGAEMLLLDRLRLADRDRFSYTVGWLDPARAGLVPEFVAAEVPLHCVAARSAADWRWLRPLRRFLRDRSYTASICRATLSQPRWPTAARARAPTSRRSAPSVTARTSRWVSRATSVGWKVR